MLMKCDEAKGDESTTKTWAAKNSTTGDQVTITLDVYTCASTHCGWLPDLLKLSKSTQRT